jgi:acyl carrier protein
MMNERFRELFAETLGISPTAVVDELQYNTIPEWDSIAHMQLVAALDNEYHIMLDTEDVIDMSSVAKIREILTKYEVVV